MGRFVFYLFIGEGIILKINIKQLINNNLAKFQKFSKNFIKNSC